VNESGDPEVLEIDIVAVDRQLAALLVWARSVTDEHRYSAPRGKAASKVGDSDW
jgi:hypothetical protein